jgi:Tfp pilus assembly protein PilO
MRDSAKTALAVLCVVVLAGAFWVLLLSPSRDKANELSERTAAVAGEISSEESKATAGLAARHNFPVLYQRLVQLGKAVPAEAATPSLLVQLQGVGRRANTSFVSINLGAEGGGGESPEVPTGESGTGSDLPLGAAIGPTGMPVMPYSFEFEGGYFEIAKFIRELDSLVQTEAAGVNAKGRLVTINGFSLAPAEESGGKSSSNNLTATFQVTTYLTPSTEGLTAGATEAGPGASETAATGEVTESTETEATP